MPSDTLLAVDLEDENGKVIVKAGAKISADDATKLAKVTSTVTWPVKAKVTHDIVYLDAYEEGNAVIAGGGNDIDDEGHFLLDRIGARFNLRSGEVDS